MDGSSARHSNNEVAGFELESLALLHAIAGGTTYRDKILNVWRFPSYTPGQITHWDLPYQVMGHALALDYLWNDISPAQRSELGTVIVAMMDDLYNYAPYNVSFANQMSDYSNQLYYHLGALAFAGIVLAGEGINDIRAQFYLSEAAILLNDHMIPAMNQEAGGGGALNASARELTVTHGGGHAWLKTVFLSAASVQLTTQAPTDLLTVRSTGSGPTVDFIHVVYVSPAAIRFIPTNLTQIDTDSQMGASFRDRQGQQWSVAFHKNGVGLAGVTNGPALSAPTGLRVVR